MVAAGKGKVVLPELDLRLPLVSITKPEVSIVVSTSSHQTQGFDSTTKLSKNWLTP